MGQYEKLEGILKNYRENKADYQIALGEFNKYYDQLLLHKKAGIESIDEVIAGMAVGAQKLSDIPRSETNKFHSATEDVMINYRYYLRPSQLEINAIQDILQEKAQLLQHFEEQIKIVDNMLKSLTDTERFVVESVYIKGFNHTQVMFMFNEEFKHCRVDCKGTIKKYKFDALRKMSKRFK